MKVVRWMRQLAWWSGLIMFVWAIGGYLVNQITPLNIPLTGALVFLPLLFGLLVGASVVRDFRNRFLLARGTDATATILSISHTEEKNDDSDGPVVYFRLDVFPPGKPHFQGEAERLIPNSDLPLYQPGKMVNVKFRERSRDIAIVGPKF